MTFFMTNGLISGMILAAFLALSDGLFQTNTFTVLIDVNYVPILAGLPAIVELFIHLGISIVVAACFFWFYPRISGSYTARYLAIWTGALSLLYIPLSLLSQQSLSLGGYAIWLIGHAIYILFLSFQVERHR